MSRSFILALMLVATGAITAQAQVYTGYYHAPPYNTYAGYAPGGFNGPLRIIDWRWWAGVAPYSPAYSYPTASAGTVHTAGYAPSAYTASYSPSVYTAGYSPSVYSTSYGPTYAASYGSSSYYSPFAYSSTSYYSPSYDNAIAYYPTPLLNAGNPCCNPCGTGYGVGCPGGNCDTGYIPSTTTPQPTVSPQPEQNSAPSSGTQTYEKNSDPVPGTGSNVPAPGSNNQENDAFGPGPNGAAPSDNWRGAFDRAAPSNNPAADPQSAPADGFGDIERGANYPPNKETIQQKAPAPKLNENDTKSKTEEPAEAETPGANLFLAPIPDPEAARPLVNRDSRVSEGPSLLTERRRMSARFGSPKLARVHAEPADVPQTKSVKMVQK